MKFSTPSLVLAKSGKKGEKERKLVANIIFLDLSPRQVPTSSPEVDLLPNTLNTYLDFLTFLYKILQQSYYNFSTKVLQTELVKLFKISSLEYKKKIPKKK